MAREPEIRPTVSLGEYEIDARRLRAPKGAEKAKTKAAAALRRTIAEPRGIDPLPATGWRILGDDDYQALFGAWDEDWDGWVLVAVVREGARWRFRGASYGARPGPTRAQRGQGLRLVWPVEVFVTRYGEHPRLRILLRNERDERWTTDRGEYWAIGSLVDATSGAAVPSTDGVWIGGVGRSYDLAPGESVSLPVALALSEPERLWPGRYELRAGVADLDLHSEVGVLVVAP